ncbi:MAG: hypothetical protein CMD51_00460 [Gammaproteobacteria bacterium]|nr:hypothetical protein [Gammaproteobacteria bacterium]
MAFIDMSALNHKNSALAREAAESQFSERRSAAESISKSIAYESLHHLYRGQATAAEALHREALCVRIQPNKLQ